MWWLDHYKEMTDFLRTRNRCILENSRLTIFDLRK
jgi:hypothetical protein